MTQRSGKFTREPVVLETVKTSCGVCHKIGPFPWTDTEKNHACIYVDDRMAWKHGPELEANAHLIVAAFNAATAAENMGYDGQAAVEALPKLLEMLAVAELLLGGNRSARDNNNFAAEIHEALASCRAKESAP